jgi:deoxycytidine triphosphate deaminase
LIEPNDVDAELADLLDGVDPSNETEDSLGVIQSLRTTLQLWLVEILCDLNTVRLYGPAGMSAIAEFLAVLRPGDPKGPQRPSDTHPSLALRLDAMFRFLEFSCPNNVPDYLSSWREYPAAEPLNMAHRPAYLSAIITKNLDEIVRHALTWGDVYSYETRSPVVVWCKKELLEGIPGGTHSLNAAAQGGRRVSVADVVNASWEARQELEAADASESGIETRPLLSRLRLGEHETRLVLDDLSSKAIDNLEFATVWRLSGGVVVNLSDLPDQIPDAASGILSKESIYARLVAEGNDRRLVVTPLVAGAVQDAGVDLRLSPDFIVFKHSAVAAFNPLSRRQDPRTLQESVVKTWGEPFILHPGELVLASTLEYIVLPSDVAAQVVTRSSYGRLGLITATAVQVQPGSRGTITLELVNHGETPIVLTPGARIAQLVLTQIGNPTQPEQGKYWFPVGPEFSKVQQDPDVRLLRNIDASSYHSGAAIAPRRRFGDRDDIVPFKLSGRFNESMFFQSLLTAESARVTVTPQADIRSSGDSAPTSRLSGGESILTYLVAGSATIPAFAAALLRLVRGLKRGVIVSVSDDGTYTVASSRELPRGRLIIVKSKDSRHTIEVVAETAVGEVAKSLSERAKKKPKDGRWVDE